MFPWERRLKDLSITLKLCHKNYFDPELFRLNLNQFLQTSRTVTFIIQKNKEEIPKFEEWYIRSIEEWKQNKILNWAKDSRNIIEKMGDLEINSIIDVVLITSYLEEQDKSLNNIPNQFLFLAIDKVYKYLKSELGYISDEEWVIKIERRWVANSLPDEELLWVMNYIYAKQYKICSEACNHMNSEISKEIELPIDMDSINSDSRQIRYFDADGPGFASLSTLRMEKDPKFKGNIELLEKHKERFSGINSFSECMDAISKNAVELFENDGYHIPMVLSFNTEFEVIDYITPWFNRRYEKFVFWREVPQRISFQNPYCVIFITESWLKQMPKDKSKYVPINDLKTTGEMLQIYGITNDGQFLENTFRILRIRDTKPKIDHKKIEYNDMGIKIPYFLQPLEKAISKLRTENKSK